MASKVSALIESATIAATDLFYGVVGGASRKVKAENVFASFTGSKHLFSYATLNAAVDAIGASQATLWITSSTTVAASKTVPSNITLKFTGTGVISVNVSQTLTINGPVEAPPRQIFTGSGVVRWGGQIEAAWARWFGTVEDDSTDDAAALQKAVDSFTGSAAAGPRAGVVKTVGPVAIASTITSTLSGVIIEGPGWGFTADSRKRGYIRWIGTTAIPMFKFEDCVRGGMRNIRLVGKSSGTKPTAAIQFNQTGGGFTLDQPVLEDVWIGPYYSGEADTGEQFDAGVLFSGNVNCDTGVFKNVNIHKCAIGVDNQNSNATVAHWDTLAINQCGTGFKTVAPHNIITNFLCSLNDVDMELAAQGVDWLIHNYISEGSGRMLVVSAASPFRFKVEGGSFQADSTSLFTGNDQTSPNRRWMIDCRNSAAGNGAWVELRNFNLSRNGSPPIPVVLVWATSDGATVSGATGSTLILDGVRGFTSDNFNIGSDNLYVSSRVVVFNRQPANGGIAPQFNRYIFSPTDSEDQAYQDGRFDIAGKGTIYGGPLKVKGLPTPNSVSVVATGGTGTTYGYRVSALTRDGETLASATVTVSGGATLSSTVYNTVSFYPVVGAYAYRIYGRTSGSELLLKTLTLAEIGDTFAAGWRDDGSLTPSGILPSLDTTGNTILNRLRLHDHAASGYQDITGNAPSTALRLSGGDDITDGPAIQIWPDASGFPSLYIDGGNNSGSDIQFRMSPNGTPALKIKQGNGSFEVNRTVTAGGTTGNQTINKTAGTVNIAASGTTVTVTNSLVTANSIVLAVLRTNDATARIANVVPGSGSFVINLTAAATAEVSIGWIVLN